MDKTVDTTGAACPVPIIELAKAIARASAGDVVVLLASDPAARKDVQAWCASTGHRLLSLRFSAGIMRAKVRKAGG
jgi:TusA-related sulfurtransferase